MLVPALFLTLLSPVRAGTPPDHYRIGAYITAIHGIDFSTGTFSADFWVWSVGSSPSRDPLQTMEFINSGTITRQLQSSTHRDDVFWRQTKILGTFRQPWNLRYFPFDTQLLEITLEEGQDDATALIYDADIANTGYLPEASPPGWRITSVTARAVTTHYTTNFGDPAGGSGSDYARLYLTIRLKRTSLAIFLNLSAPLYAAFLLCIVSFLLHKDGQALVESRLALLAAALFAVVLNMRSVSTILGNEHDLTVVDRLHILVLIEIVIATLVTIAAGIARDRDKRFPRSIDYTCCAILGLSFVAINTLLIAAAVRASSGA